MNSTVLYKGYRLATMTTQNDDGSYRARVAIMLIGTSRPCSQRFADFETFLDRAAAEERAIEGGKAWIDDQLGLAGRSFPTEFATLD